MDPLPEEKLIKKVPPASPQRGYGSIFAHGTSGQAPKPKVDLKGKRKVYDNVHGFISFSEKIWQFIDTPHFQRLRSIKQLGLLHYVFPGATHTRFQHSLGTGHLAKTFIQHLIQNHKQVGQEYYDPAVQEQAKFTVTLAGLMHDLGHGPYSHTFDSSIVGKFQGYQGEGSNRVKKIIDWKHQIASLVLFDHLIIDNNLKEITGITDPQINRIKALINGKRDATRPWEFDLISNEKNGIDVDKFDYFRRDAFYLGAKNIYIDHELLMSEARIIQNEICYPTKYAQKVNDIFHSRYKLYKGFYFNIISRGVQFMICDILNEVKDYFKFKQACQLIYDNPDPYMKLSDNLIELIPFIYQNMETTHPLKTKFQNAVGILKDIHRRKIYKFVKEIKYYLPQSKTQEEQKKLKEIEQIFKNKQKYISFIADKLEIPENWLCMSVTDSGFGSKTKNPLRNVGFFNKYLPKLKKQKHAQNFSNFSMLFTNSFIQRSAKIYLKNFQDTNLFFKVEQAFDLYCTTVLNEKFLKSGLTVIYDGQLGKSPYITLDTNASVLQQSAEKKKKQEVIAVHVSAEDDQK